jgi:hypothetical protein
MSCSYDDLDIMLERIMAMLRGKIERRNSDAANTMEYLARIVRVHGIHARTPLLQDRDLAQAQLELEIDASPRYATLVDRIVTINDILTLLDENRIPDEWSASGERTSFDERTASSARTAFDARTAFEVWRADGGSRDAKERDWASYPRCITNSSNSSQTDEPDMIQLGVIRGFKNQTTGAVLDQIRRCISGWRTLIVLDFDATIAVNVQTIKELIRLAGGRPMDVENQIRRMDMLRDMRHQPYALVPELHGLAELDIPIVVVTKRNHEGVREVEAILREIIPNAQVIGTINADGGEIAKSIIIADMARYHNAEVIYYLEDSEHHRQDVMTAFASKPYELNVYEVDLEREITKPIMQQMMMM